MLSVLSSREKRILELLAGVDCLSSAALSSAVRESSGASAATVKRDLAHLLSLNLIVREGDRRSTRYRLSDAYRVLRPIDLSSYYSQDVDDRHIIASFDWELLRSILPTARIFTEDELEGLNALQTRFSTVTGSLSDIALIRDLEHLAIDLSWKSSQIEGNTYTLLETERLLRESVSVDGKTREEATMLLNHKKAIDHILAHRESFTLLTQSIVSDIHRRLIVGLPRDETQLRSTRVGIVGTRYQPPDSLRDIDRALNETCELINARQNVFDKALLALVLISYLQPFEDGNKRTARLVSNALLLGHGHCPLSFRTVDSLRYKQALLLFYEQHNLSNLKDLFIEQYAFAVNTYF